MKLLFITFVLIRFPLYHYNNRQSPKALKLVFVSFTLWIYAISSHMLLQVIWYKQEYSQMQPDRIRLHLQVSVYAVEAVFTFCKSGSAFQFTAKFYTNCKIDTTCSKINTLGVHTWGHQRSPFLFKAVWKWVWCATKAITSAEPWRRRW